MYCCRYNAESPHMPADDLSINTLKERTAAVKEGSKVAKEAPLA